MVLGEGLEEAQEDGKHVSRPVPPELADSLVEVKDRLEAIREPTHTQGVGEGVWVGRARRWDRRRRLPLELEGIWDGQRIDILHSDEVEPVPVSPCPVAKFCQLRDEQSIGGVDL